MNTSSTNSEADGLMTLDAQKHHNSAVIVYVGLFEKGAGCKDMSRQLQGLGLFIPSSNTADAHMYLLCLGLFNQ